MRYQKIMYLLENTSDKLRKSHSIEMNDQSVGVYDTESDI